MIMKQMPYKIPDGFFEESKAANRAAIRSVENARIRPARRILRWSVSAAATAACLAIGLIAYSESGHRTEFDNLIAELENASDELIYEMSSDMVEYPEDINLL